MKAILGGLALAALLGGWPFLATLALADSPWNDEVVPAGVWLYEWEAQRDYQNKAWNRGGKLRPLRTYLLSTHSLQDNTTGKVTRTVDRLDLALTYGVSDRTNLVAELRYVQAEQKGTLVSTTTNPLEQAEVETFSDQKLAGFGGLTLRYLYRPVFDDENGLVWGLGALHSLMHRDARPGPRSLELREPNPAFQALLHYTRYLFSSGGRFDLRLDVELNLNGKLETVEGTTQRFRHGNQVQLHLGWAQDIGSFTWGIGVQERRQAQSRLNGVGQSDPENERGTLLRIGYGNLRQLEHGPVAFPYQFVVEWVRTEKGFNIIHRNDIILTFRYFL